MIHGPHTGQIYSMKNLGLGSIWPTLVYTSIFNLVIWDQPFVVGQGSGVTCYKLWKIISLARFFHEKEEVPFSSVQSLSHVRLFATPWITAHQASLSITNSQSSPKPMSIKSVTPSNYLILCGPLFLLPSVFPSIRVFSNESALLIRWPKYWSFSFNISPSSEHPGLISFSMDWLDLLAVQRRIPSIIADLEDKEGIWAKEGDGL